MFGDIMGLMGKLKETQKKVAETKKRLDTVLISEQSSNGRITLTMTANRTVKTLDIDETLLHNKEALEDYLIVTINKAIDKATQISETELAAVAKEGMPNIPGVDSLLK